MNLKVMRMKVMRTLKIFKVLIVKTILSNDKIVKNQIKYFHPICRIFKKVLFMGLHHIVNSFIKSMDREKKKTREALELMLLWV